MKELLLFMMLFLLLFSCESRVDENPESKVSFIEPLHETDKTLRWPTFFDLAAHTLDRGKDSRFIRGVQFRSSDPKEDGIVTSYNVRIFADSIQIAKYTNQGELFSQDLLEHLFKEHGSDKVAVFSEIKVLINNKDTIVLDNLRLKL